MTPRLKLVIVLLALVTAAVVGVILNLAVWFGVHVLVPDGHSPDWIAAGISTIAFTGMVRWKWDILPVIAGAGVIGILIRALVPA